MLIWRFRKSSTWLLVASSLVILMVGFMFDQCLGLEVESTAFGDALVVAVGGEARLPAPEASAGFGAALVNPGIGIPLRLARCINSSNTGAGTSFTFKASNCFARS